MASEEYTVLLGIWPLVMMEVSRLEKEPNTTTLNKFLTKCLKLLAENMELPELPLNASNELCKILLFDINSLSEQVGNDKEGETQLQDYILRGRGWKLLRLLLHLKAKNLSYEYELAKILTSILTDLVELPFVSSTMPTNLCRDVGRNCNFDQIKTECETLAVSNSLHPKARMQRIERKKHLRKYKRSKMKLKVVENETVNKGNSDSDEPQPARITFIPPIMSSPVLNSRNPFEYYSQQHAKSDSECEPIEVEEEKLKRLIFDWEEDVSWSISAVDLSKITIDLLVIIFNQYSRTRLQESHIQSFVESVSELYFCLLSTEWGPKDWSDQSKDDIRHYILNLLYSLSSALISCSKKNYDSLKNTIEILLSCTSKYFNEEIISPRLACDTYLSSVCLLNQYMRKSHFLEKEDQLFFVGLLRMFSDIKFCKMANKIISEDNCELINLLGTCVKEFVKISQYALLKLQNFPSKLMETSLDHLECHHHVEVFGEPYQTCSEKESLCIMSSITRCLLGLFSIMRDTSIKLLVIDTLSLGGICCCITPAGLVEGFRSGLTKTKTFLCHKTLVVMEKLIQNISEKTCEFCDVSETWNTETWLINYWSLYKNLFLSMDCSRSNVVCHYLLRLIETKPKEHRFYILNYIAAPLFEKGRLKYATESDSLTLEFSLVALSKLLEHKSLVSDFLKVFPLEQFENFLTETHSFNHEILDILKYIVLATSKDQNPAYTQDEIHPGAVSLFNNVLLKCNVDFFSLAIEKRESDYDKCIEELEYIYKAWLTCKDLLQCQSYRSLFLSSLALAIVYKLFLEILEHFQKESKCENPDSNCPDIKIVQLLEATLSVCLNLVPFYDISEAEHISEQHILVLTEQSLRTWIPDSVKKLRHLYDSLFMCFMGEFQTHFAINKAKWTLHSLDLNVTESYLGDVSDSDGELSTDLFYNGDVDTDDESLLNVTEDCAKDHKKILHPSVLNLTLRLLTEHIEKLAQSNRDAAGKLDIAVHVVQRLIGLCQNEGQSCSSTLKQQGALQMIYSLLACSSNYSNVDANELKQSLIKLWSSIVVKAGITTAEIFNYLKLFSSSYNCILVSLLDGFCSVLDSPNRESSFSVRFPIQFIPSLTTFNLEIFGVRKDADQYNLGDLDFSQSENISMDFPMVMWHILGNRMTVDFEARSIPPWNVTGAIMPLVQDADWSPRQKNGFSVSLWIKMKCQASKHDFLDAQHVLSVGSDFWLMELWLDFKNHSFVIYITEATKKEYICLRKPDFDFPLKLETNKWHHLVVTYKEVDNIKGKYSNAKISLVLDGFMVSNPVPTFCLNKTKKSHRASYILIGHSIDKEVESFPNINCYELGNVFLFKSLILQLNQCFLLAQLGPDQQNLTHGLLDAKPCNFVNLFLDSKYIKDFINSGIDIKEVESKADELLQSLREHFYVAYNPRKPTNYLVYPHVMDFKEMYLPIVTSGHQSNFRVAANDNRPTQQYPVDLPLSVFGKFHQRLHQSLLCSIEHLGGGNLFLFLFAKLVEMSDDEHFQAESLRLLLKCLNNVSKCQSRPYLHAKPTNFNLSSASFEEMLKFIFSNSKCLTRSRMLLVVVNESVSSPVLSPSVSRNEISLEINNRTEAVILHPWIFATLISSWSAFENNQDLISLFQSLNVLVRDKHPFRKFNVQQLLRVDVVTRVTFFLKEKVLDSQSQIPYELGDILSTLMRNLLGMPPNFELLESVWGSLIVLHPPDYSFIYYKPGRTYFTIPVSHTNNKIWENRPGSVKSSESSEGINAEEDKNNILSDSGIDEKVLTDNDLFNTKASKLIANLKIKDAEISSSKDDKSVSPAELTINSQPEDIQIVTPILDDENVEEGREFGPGEGLQVFISGVYNMLYEFLLTLPDSAMPLILPKSFNLETTLLLSNHPHRAVRCSVLQLLGAHLQRLPLDHVDNYLKYNGFQLLANQLHQFGVNQSILDACTFLALRHIKEKHDASPEEFGLNTSIDLLPEQVYSSLSVLGVLVNASEDLALSHNALGILSQIVQIVRGACCILVENGLIEVLCSFIIKITHKTANETDLEGVFEIDLLIVDILNLVTLIGKQLVRSSNTLENACNLLHNGITQFTVSYINSLEQCGSESNCVRIFRDCVCSLISESLLSMEHTLDTVGRLLSRTESSHLSSISNIPLYERHESSSFINARWEKRRSQTFAGNLSSYDSSPAEILEKYCQLVAMANDFLIHREPNSAISSLELEFSTRLLVRLLDELEGNLATGLEAPKYYRRVAVLKDTSSELSKLLLWLLSPYSTINKRLEVVNLLVSRWKHEEIIGAVLRHMTQHVSQQFLSFLYDLLYQLKHKDNTDVPTNEATNTPICQSIYQLIDDVIKWYGRSMTCLDNEIIEKAINIWCENSYRDRCLWHAKIRITARRLQQDFVQLDKELSSNAIKITSDAVSYQNIQRKDFMIELKRSLGRKMEAEKCWHIMLEKMTHEKSVWHDPKSYPQSWQLDPTEGPQRVRRRLQRCHLRIPSKFFRDDFKKGIEIEEHPQPLSYLFNNGDSTSGTAALVERLHSDERIIYHCTCFVITPALEVSGEILIGEKCIHFVREKNHIPFSGLGSHPAQVWPFEDIIEVQFRRFQLKDSALEIFLASGHTHLVAFPTSKARDDFWQNLVSNSIPNMTAPDQLSTFTEKWRQRQLSNFEYLTQLNKLAGRSFNDLMQYPVFPFILADYTSEELDLSNPDSYRNLLKPMAVQDSSKETYYVNLYNFLKKEHEISKDSDDMLMPTTGPFHYGSHYSNSGTVLHFLVRLPPFTQMFLSYQGQSFDIPDRTFHSLHTSWRLASNDSTTDVKELIPEFFFLPEFLSNNEGFNLGKRQSGEVVNNIVMPQWCINDARKFILVHRQALESDHVRSNINKWIDLVFGYKQTGKAAVDAINVFHPATYYGMDASNIEDSLKRNAIITMIRTFGQMPKQLFQSSHSLSGSGTFQFLSSKPEVAPQKPVLKEVHGLKWGNYVGSPAGPTPIPVLNSRHNLPIGNLVPLLTNDIYALTANSCLLLTYSKDKGVLNTIFVTTASLITWGHVDGIIRIKLKRDSSPVPLMADKTGDPVTVCATIPDCSFLFLGRSSGVIDVHLLDLQTGQNVIRRKGPSVCLIGHRSKITSLYINKVFNVFASGGQDGEVLLWDLNSMNYIRCLSRMEKDPVQCLCISDTLGDVAAVTQGSTQCCLIVRSINGYLVGQVTLPIAITALCYSSTPEGLSVNVIATGLADGSVRFWSSWNLECVREITQDSLKMPISCLSYSMDNQYLYVCYSDGQVIVYHKNSKTNRIPRFLTVL